MHKKPFTLTAEIGNLLAKRRKQARLTQKEVAERLCLSIKSGKMYISKLEQGKIKNPSMNTILHYLIVCNIPWVSFFEKLSGIYFKKKHWEVFSQVDVPRHYKKIDRDVAKYRHSIETKFSEKRGIKPLTEEKQDKMTLGLLKHRAFIEPIEDKVQKLLGHLNTPIVYNQFYKDFVRECYSAYKKFKKPRMGTDKKKEKSCLDICGLSKELDRITEKWVKKGLDMEILEKVKDIVISFFYH